MVLLDTHGRFEILINYNVKITSLLKGGEEKWNPELKTTWILPVWHPLVV
jgi:hypothetical protein